MKISALFALAALALLPAPVPAQAGQPLQRAIQESCATCSSTPFTRRQLTGDVFEYSTRVRVGPGPLEVIGLHRVVRELAPFVPRPTERAVLMAHGDAWGFDGAFLSALASPAAPDSRSLPVFLARNGIDVWGIDFRWTQVPEATTDFSALAGWGIETDARDLGIALGVARTARTLGGSGLDKIHLLAWSRGGQIGYAYLNAESQLPRRLRQVRGYVPVDTFFKSDVDSVREAACLRLAGQQQLFDTGAYQAATGLLFRTIGQLAETAPGGSSPVVPGLTNRQAGLVTGALTFTFFPPGQEFVPVYHFNAGTFDASGLPTTLTYTEAPYWFDFLQGTAPYEPTRLLLDAEKTVCDEEDVRWDDHLADIRVPVLYLGAGGGVGEFGTYTTTLLGSSDVTVRIVDFEPAASRLEDFGHVDLFTARDAESLAWRPLLRWLRAH